MNLRSEQERYMARALELAERGLFTARPNPCVGCVIVQYGQIVGEGYHHQAGQAHAEVGALKAAGSLAVGATCYVTLEPCAHTGRTGPCAEALIQAKVGCVVAAIEDPNPLVAGQGFARLRAAGIKVVVGILSDEAKALNAGFLMRIAQARPYVRVKMAMSMDGRTALANGQSRWISSSLSRVKVQYWRARSGAILSTAQTALHDNSHYLVREPHYLNVPGFQQPKRVLLDTHKRLLKQPSLQCWQDGAETWWFTGEGDLPNPIPQHVTHYTAPVTEKDGMDLKQIFQKLAALQIQDVLVEAGGIFLGQLLAENLVDELIIFMAPTLLGSAAKPLAVFTELQQLAEAPQFSIIESESIGPDLYFRALVQKGIS